MGEGGILQIVIWVVDCRLKRQNLDCRLVFFKDDNADFIGNPCRRCQFGSGRCRQNGLKADSPLPYINQ